MSQKRFGDYVETRKTMQQGLSDAEPLNYGVAATADNQAYTLLVPLASLADGKIVVFKMPGAATAGAVTLNVNGLGARKVYRPDMVNQVSTLELLANGVYILAYSSSLDAAAGGWVCYGLDHVNQILPSNYALAATADNIAYTLPVNIQSLANGARVIMKMPAADSGAAPTLNVSGLGAKKILYGSDNRSAPFVGGLIANGIYQLIYDSSLDAAAGAWVVMNHLEQEAISAPLAAFVPNTTVGSGVMAVSRGFVVTGASIACKVVPADADGTMTMRLFNYDLSAVADDPLMAAVIDCETLVAKNGTALGLTGVAADLILSPGDYVYADLVNNSAAIDTPWGGAVVTLYGYFNGI